MLAARVAPEMVGMVGAQVLIDGRASVGATTYAWTLLDSPPGHAVLGVADEAVATFRATEPGKYLLRLVVGDEHGAGDGALTVVTVTRPTLDLEAPRSVRQFDSFMAKARVPPDLAGEPLSWSEAPRGALDVSPSDTDPLSASVIARSTGKHALTVRLDGVGDAGLSGTIEIDVDAPDQGDPDDAAYWQEQMRDANRSALDTVQDSAKTWQGMLAGVLGLFGTVSLVAAPSLEDLSQRSTGQLALALVAAAFLAAVLAMRLVTRLVASGIRIRQTPDPASYGERVLAAAEAQTRALERSKVLAFTAASLVAASGLVLAGSQLGSDDAPTEPPLVLVRTSTSTVCGEMGVTGDTGALTVAGDEVGVAREVLPVDACAPTDEPEEVTGIASWPPYLLGLVVGSVLIGVLIGLGTARPPRMWLLTAASAALGYALAFVLSAAPFSWWHLGAAVVVAVTTMLTVRDRPRLHRKGTKKHVDPDPVTG